MNGGPPCASCSGGARGYLSLSRLLLAFAVVAPYVYIAHLHLSYDGVRFDDVSLADVSAGRGRISRKTAADASGIRDDASAGRSARTTGRGLSRSASSLFKDFDSVVLRISVCNGLTNQRMALLDGLVLGVLLGVQVLLPSQVLFNGATPRQSRAPHNENLKDFEDLFDVPQLEAGLEKLYRQYWCREDRGRPRIAARWCSGVAKPVFLLGEAGVEESISKVFGKLHPVSSRYRLLSLEKDFDARLPLTFAQVGTIRDFLHATSGEPMGMGVGAHTILDARCTLFALPIKQGHPSWDLFWQLNSALHFSPAILTEAYRLKRAIEAKYEEAQRKAVVLGYPRTELPQGEGAPYNVLHLRAEEDWLRHCEKWMAIRDDVHRDNCINNTLAVGNVLLTEGVPPGVPLYLSTGLSRGELYELQARLAASEDAIPSLGTGLANLLDVYTVVLKEDVLKLPRSWAGSEREFYAAVDFVLSQDANVFVGNSVSTFSAFTIIDRRRRGLQAFHYNGGGIPLTQVFLQPKEGLSIPTLRTPIKWVFAIHVSRESDLSETFVNMLKVAVLSAAAETELVPICVTTLPIGHELVRWMLHNGVRVVPHQPRWADAIRDKVLAYSRWVAAEDIEDPRKWRSHLLGDPEAMVGTFLRIDVPILGILDEFVLYTDVDVLFAAEVTWKSFLGDKLAYLSTVADFAAGKFHASPPGVAGLPLYFSASSEMDMSADPNLMNAGVMLLNMRNLRASHAAFLDFILQDDDLDWPQGPGDQGAYKTFYSRSNDTCASFLPLTLNWKTYWRRNLSAVIVHFHGPKCENDILPFRDNKVERTKTVFDMVLKRCRDVGDCFALCDRFMAYLQPDAPAEPT